MAVSWVNCICLDVELTMIDMSLGCCVFFFFLFSKSNLLFEPPLPTRVHYGGFGLDVSRSGWQYSICNYRALLALHWFICSAVLGAHYNVMCLLTMKFIWTCCGHARWIIISRLHFRYWTLPRSIRSTIVSGYIDRELLYMFCLSFC